MTNLVTHKANRDNGVFSIPGNAGNASSTVVLYQDFFYGGEEKALTFFQGSSEPSVGDNVIVGGAVIGKLESYTLASGTWAGTAIGTLFISDMTIAANFPATWSTSSGGAGTCGATEVELRETSINNSNVSDMGIEAISDNGERIKLKAGIHNPNNAINWTESDATEAYEALVLIVCKADIAWSVAIGDQFGTGGAVFMESANKGVTIHGADNSISLSGVDAFALDGSVHTYAALLRPGISPSYSFEVDGVETATDAGTNAGLIDMSVENQIEHTGLIPYGMLVCRFKAGIPADYRLAIEEMKDAWVAGEVGISSRFIGVK